MSSKIQLPPSNVCQDMAFVQYSRLVQQLLEQQLHLRYTKVGFPLYPVYDALLLPELIASTSSTTSRRHDQEEAQDQMEQSIGMLHYLTFNAKHDQNVIDLHLASGFPYLITALNQDNKSLQVHVQPNLRFFQACHEVGKPHSRGDQLSKTEYIRSIQCHGCPVVTNYNWHSLFQSYLDLAQLEVNRFQLSNNSNNKNNKKQSNKQFMNQLMHRLAQYTLSSDATVENMLLDDQINQLGPLGTKFIMNLKQVRDKVFDVARNSAYVTALVASVLSVLVAERKCMHFSLLYNCVLGFPDSFFNQPHLFREQCPLQEYLLSDDTKSFKTWLSKQADKSVNSRLLLAVLFQVCWSLCYVQRQWSFTHNNLHVGNLGYLELRANQSNHMLYRWKSKVYLVPLYGQLIKIDNLHTASIMINGTLYCASTMSESTQNPSSFNYDLLRLGATLLPLLQAKLNPQQEPVLYENLMIMVQSWTLCAYQPVIQNINDIIDPYNNSNNSSHSNSVELRSIVQDVDECLRSEVAGHDCAWHPFTVASHQECPYALPDLQTLFFKCFEVPVHSIRPSDHVFTMYDNSAYLDNNELDERSHYLQVVRAVESNRTVLSQML